MNFFLNYIIIFLCDASKKNLSKLLMCCYSFCVCYDRRPFTNEPLKPSRKSNLSIFPSLLKINFKILDIFLFEKYVFI